VTIDAHSGRGVLEGAAAAPLIAATTSGGEEKLFLNARSLFVTSARSRRRAAAATAGAVAPDEWTDEEDAELFAAVEKVGMRAWTRVAESVEGRRAHECEARWAAILTEQLQEARTRQQAAHAGGVAAERELSEVQSTEWPNYDLQSTEWPNYDLDGMVLDAPRC